MANSDHSGLEVNIVGRAADVSTKEEVPDWAKAYMQAMRDKLGEVVWGEEFGQLGGVQCMEKSYTGEGYYRQDYIDFMA